VKANSVAVRYNWNCPQHGDHDPSCADCLQITKEMQPEYCVFGMGRNYSPHELDEHGRCRCGYREARQ
jgi:hypothetical protein